MKKRYAIISDVHGNIKNLLLVLNDIKRQNIDDIYCLGDSVGNNSKECIDELIKNNVKMVLGNKELDLLNNQNIKESLTTKEIDYIKSCPLYYKINIEYANSNNKEIILSHYLIKDEHLKYPFEDGCLKKDDSLWIKYNNPNITYIIGHLHKHFDVNEVDGISGDYIEQTGTLTNIEIVDSLGSPENEDIPYTIIEIDKNIKFERVTVKVDR